MLREGVHVLARLGAGSDVATFTLTTADEQVIRNPSPDQIGAVIDGLPAGADAFAILANDADELTYIQAIGSPSEGFGLEYQDGSLDKHFQCTNQDLTAEHVVLAFRSYQRGETDWKTAFKWERVEL